MAPTKDQHDHYLVSFCLGLLIPCGCIKMTFWEVQITNPEFLTILDSRNLIISGISEISGNEYFLKNKENFYSAVKKRKNEILKFPGKWMELEKTNTKWSILFVDPNSKSLVVTTISQKEKRNRWQGTQHKLKHQKRNPCT